MELGLGNLGALASKPVMEGKALLFKKFGGVDAFPICLDTQDVEKIIETTVLPCLFENQETVIILFRDVSHFNEFMVLKEANLARRGVIHCFTGDYNAARSFIDAGYMLGIGGVCGHGPWLLQRKSLGNKGCDAKT